MTYVKINDLLIGDKRIMFRGLSESPQLSKRETLYSGYDGSDYDDITFPSRLVTVNGTLFGTSYDDIDALKKTLTDICNPKKEVELCYFNGSKEYYAPAFPSFPAYSKVNNYTYQFAIYFDFPKFYWQSEEISQPIYGTADNVFGEEITFPRPLSILSQGADIYNRGSVEAPIVIEILATEDFFDTIEISNITYDKHITIENYSMVKGEIITIDTDEQAVTSSINGNIISYVSEMSELFYLPLGYTRIECNRDGLTVVFKHRERYLEV